MSTTETPSGAYRYKAGDFVVTAVWDGFNPLALKEGFVRNATLADVQDTLEAQFLPRETLNITFTPLVLQHAGRTVLIDTGFGRAGPDTAGRFPANLEAAGIAAGTVTDIVFSHFHGDHVNGLRGAGGELVFANARLHAPRPEWEFWMDDARMEQAAEAQRKPFEMLRRIFGGLQDQVTLFAWDEEVVPGVTALDARGHTPGHTAFMIGTGDDRLLMISDVTNHPALFMTHPDWAAAFDMDADEARKTRRRVLDMAASERLRIAGYHLPFPATGYVERQGDGFRFVPSQWLYGA